MLVLIDVDGLIELIEFILFAPVFRVLELIEGFLRYELSRTQVSQQRLVVVGCGRLAAVGCRRIVSLFRA